MPDEIEETTEVSETETDDTQNPGGDSGEEKLLTQAEVDRLVQKRLKRQEEQLLKKYADYDARVEESENFRKLQDEKATDAERWEKERQKLLADLQAKDEKLTTLERTALIADLATDAKLPKSFWKRIGGSTQEEIAEDIASLVEDLGLNTRDDSKEKTPANRKRGSVYGGGGEHEDPDPDTDSIVSKIPRGPQLRVEKPRTYQ